MDKIFVTICCNIYFVSIAKDNQHKIRACYGRERPTFRAFCDKYDTEEVTKTALLLYPHIVEFRYACKISIMQKCGSC